MISSSIPAFQLLSFCFLSFFDGLVFALLPKASEYLTTPLLDSRRQVLTKSISGTIAIATASTVPPVFASNDEDNPLLSLESAATQLRDGGNDPLSHRLNYPHSGLRRRASPVTSFGSDLETIVNALIQVMETDASTTVQYGIDARIIILKGVAAPNGSSFYKPDGGNSNVPITVFCNPNILSRSSEDKMVQWREYCLVGGSSQQQLLEVDLLRDETVEVAAQDITGKPIRIALGGEASRAFQHELDHLNGILIVDHAGLNELPSGIAFLEKPFHASRQKKAYERSIYQGNGPLYY